MFKLKLVLYVISCKSYVNFGLVAQLVRALPRHGRGQKFESSRAHPIIKFVIE